MDDEVRVLVMQKADAAMLRRACTSAGHDAVAPGRRRAHAARARPLLRNCCASRRKISPSATLLIRLFTDACFCLSRTWRRRPLGRRRDRRGQPAHRARQAARTGHFPDRSGRGRTRRSARRSWREMMPDLRRRKMPAAELALMTRQLSSLLGAGVQLVEALGALSDQSARAATKRMLSQVRERVREGLVAGRCARRLIADFFRSLHRDGARGRRPRRARRRCSTGSPSTASGSPNSSPRCAAR